MAIKLSIMFLWTLKIKYLIDMEKPPILININSFGNNSRSKWERIKSQFTHHDVQWGTRDELNQKALSIIKKNGEIILGGGDGTFHHILNYFRMNQVNFNDVKIGFLGLGSSCSFLRSSKEAILIDGIPCLCQPKNSHSIDLLEVELFYDSGHSEKKLVLANGSIGFLALANLIFNSDDFFTNFIKSISTEVANQFVFVQTLSKYSPLVASINGQQFKKYLTIQFLKSANYTTDYKFERNNSWDSGQFDFHFFEYLGLGMILKTFLYLTLTNEFIHPSHGEQRISHTEILCAQNEWIELDGEVFEAKKISITCLPKILTVMGGK